MHSRLSSLVQVQALLLRHNNMIKKIPSALAIAILIFGFLGFVDASFLAAEHYFNAIPPCFVTHGCETVTTSTYSKLAGFPVAYLGALYYLSVLLLAMYYVQKEKLAALRLMHFITFVGFIFSAYLIYLQAEKIHAWCAYCLTSAATTTILMSLCAVAVHTKSPEVVSEPSV